jgi:RHS repeat-associated protein
MLVDEYDNSTTGNVTTSYYLGGKLIAQKEGETLIYVYQDSLSSTSVMADANGETTGTIKFTPFGGTWLTTGTIATDKKFTGQRLDDTGLYYYGARYYDATIGRFISPDSIVPDPANPQTFNRYSYCLNNPLKYVDPSGNVLRSTEYAGSYYLWDDDGSFSSCSSNLSEAQLQLLSYIQYKGLESASIGFGDNILFAFSGGFVLMSGGVPGEGAGNSAYNIFLAVVNLLGAGIPNSPSSTTPNWSEKDSRNFDASQFIGTSSEPSSGILGYYGYGMASSISGGGTKVDTIIQSSRLDFGFSADLWWNKNGEYRTHMTLPNGSCLVPSGYLSAFLPSGNKCFSSNGSFHSISFPEYNPTNPNDCSNMRIVFTPHNNNYSGWIRPFTVQVDIK